MNNTSSPQNPTRDQQWTMNLEAAVAYHDEHGMFPSARHTDDSTRSLGAWLSGQRTAAKGGRGATALTNERRAALQFTTPPTKPAAAKRDVTWAKRLDEYRTHMADGQPFNTSLRNSEDQGEARLGAWLMTQRAAFKNDELTAERTASLEGIAGHQWETADARFAAGLAALDTYIEVHG